MAEKLLHHYDSKESMSDKREIKIQQFEMNIGSRTNVTVLFVLILGVYSKHVASVNTALSIFFSSQLYRLLEPEKTIKRCCQASVSRRPGVFRIFNYDSHVYLFSRTTTYEQKLPVIRYMCAILQN